MVRKINKKRFSTGFTLIELLGVIAVLSLIISFVIVISNNVIKNAKEKSYKVTVNNIEKIAANYAFEYQEKHKWLPIENTDNEYFCILVDDLIETGFLRNDVLDSYISDNIKVKRNDYVYLERSELNKTITKNLLLSYYSDDNNYCGDYATGVDIEFIEEPAGWSREKNVTINYKIFNLIDNLSTYKYKYDFNNMGKSIDWKNFDNLLETEVINNVASNGVIDAYIKSNNLDRKLSYEIKSIDREIPAIELLIDGNTVEESKKNGKRYAKSRKVTISLVDDKSGLKNGKYTIKYEWSLKPKNCDQLVNSVVVSVSDSTKNKISKDVTFSDYTGKGVLYVCAEGVSDNVGNVRDNEIEKIDLYLDNIKPIVSLGNYDGENIVSKSVTIPLLVKDDDSGIKKDSFIADDIEILVGNVRITSGITLSYVSDNKYNLKIDNNDLNGKITLKIGNDKLLDNAENGNDSAELDTGVTFINTYLVKFDANGGIGAPNNQLKIHDVNLTLSSIKPTKTGFSFDGWKDSDGVKYNAGGTYNKNSDTTMVAQWKSIKKYIIKNGVVQSEAGGLKAYNHQLLSHISGEDPLIRMYNGFINLTNNNWINCTGTVYTVNKIDFKGFSYLKFDGDIYAGDATMGGGIKIHSDVRYGNAYWDYGLIRQIYTSSSYQHIYNHSINVSDLNSSYYVGFTLAGNNYHSQNYINVYNLWLE